MFLLTFLVVNTAGNKRKLNNDVFAVSGIANKYNCIKSIEILPYHPLGISKCKKLEIQPGYKNEKFLQKEILEEFVQIIKVNTPKPVLIK